MTEIQAFFDMKLGRPNGGTLPSVLTLLSSRGHRTRSRFGALRIRDRFVGDAIRDGAGEEQTRAAEFRAFRACQEDVRTRRTG